MDITVKIADRSFSNPVTVASGTFPYSEEYYRTKEVLQLGAIIPKTVTLNPREGNPPPRIVESPSGMLNAIGIENPGADEFIAKKLPKLQKTGVPLIVSVSGNNDAEFVSLAEKFDRVKGIAALELNLSCPNLGHHNLVAQDPQATERVVKLVKKAASMPVIAKLSPNVTDISEIAVAAESAGADAVSLVNTFQAMVIDVNKRCSKLGNFTGGLSGPAIRPIAVYMTYKTAKRIKIPIIAMGGIMTAEDALQFLMAGAHMIAVGTFNFIDPAAPIKILDGIKQYMRKNKMNSLKELRGCLNGPER
jgi:dihydroorotate dehydrogenase (NAD+) catalytic subunit